MCCGFFPGGVLFCLWLFWCASLVFGCGLVAGLSFDRELLQDIGNEWYDVSVALAIR